MTRYISNPDNLKLMMNMLKEKSRNIQFEAFHVFKVINIYSPGVNFINVLRARFSYISRFSAAFSSYA